jgi:hypothetical protein
LVKIRWNNENDVFRTQRVVILDSIATYISPKGTRFRIKILGQGTDCAAYTLAKKYQKELICPVCGRRKNAADELCNACNDEIANTCYKCGRYAYNVNGGLCDDCKSRICPICNGKKDPQDDLCADCHNLIEEAGAPESFGKHK